MVRDINHLTSRPATSQPTKSAEPSSQDKGSAPAESQPAGSKLELSPQANSLKAAELQTQGLPDVDMDRVASIKKALESGDFSIDAQQVADKMLAFDALLAR